MALREKGELGPALLHLRHVADSDPTNASVRYEVGQTLRQNGDLEGAIAALEKAIEIDPELREGYYGLGVALRQQSAAARRTPPAAVGHQPRRRPLPARPGGGGAWRAGPSPGSSSPRPSAWTRAMPTPTTSWDTSWASRESSPPRWPTWSARSRSRPTPPPPTTTSVSRCGTAAPGTGPWPSCGGRSSSTPPLATAMRFSAWRCGRRATWRGPGPACSAPSPSCRPPPPSTSTSASPISRRAISTRRWDSSRPGSTSPRPRGRGRTGSRPAPPSSGRWSTSPDRAEAHNVQGLLLGRQGADAGQGGGRVPRGHPAPTRLRPGPQQPRSRARTDRRRRGGHRRAPRGHTPGARLCGCTLQSRRGPHHVRRRRGHPRARDGRGPGAHLREGPVQPGRRLRHQPRPRAGRGDRAAAEGGRARPDVRPGPPGARQGASSRTVSVDEAIEALQEAARLEPERGDAHYQLGLALARAGRRKEAAPVLEKGRELVADDERNQKANLDLAEGRAALQGGDLEHAAVKLRSAVRLRPDSSEAQRSLGEVLEKQGDAGRRHRRLSRRPWSWIQPTPTRRRGLERLGSCRRRAPDDPERVAELEGYIREGRFEEVEPLLAEYVKQHPRLLAGAGTLSATAWAPSRRSASPCRPWPDPSSWTSGTPRPTR